MDEMVRVPLGVVTPDALIVDVGGGVGGAMMSLYKTSPSYASQFRIRPK